MARDHPGEHPQDPLPVAEQVVDHGEAIDARLGLD
jgi:hypothetical protein